MPSNVEQIQAFILGRIQAHAPLRDMPAVSLRPRESGSAVLIQNAINDILQGLTKGPTGKNGAGIVVNLPQGDNPNEMERGPVINLIYSVRILENPLLNMGANGTQMTAEMILEELLPLLHSWVLGDINATMLAEKHPFAPVMEYLAEGKVVYDCFFRIQVRFNAKRAMQPKIAGNAADGVTITSLNPDAVIWYTLDGSYPTPTNGSAAPTSAYELNEAGDYVLAENGDRILSDAGPIAVTAGQTVLAVAYVPNQQASDLAFKTVS